MKKLVTLVSIMVMGLYTLSANNIAISNLSLTGKNTTDHYTVVQFDISWDNSWRTSTNESNWDAAWVFVKYRVAGGAWQHAWLNETGHTAPSGSTIIPGLLDPGAAFNATTNPGLGVFIHRSTDGTGTFTLTGVQLRWNYGDNGVADGNGIDIQVFAIEMVYVPQGNFYVGDGTTTNVLGQFTAHNTTANYRITSESVPATLGGTTAGNLGNNNKTGMYVGYADDFDNVTTRSLPAVFPKGYQAFYCMKYEMSQQQYVDFLNTLTSTQAPNRYSSVSTGNRYGISVSGGVYSTTNPYVACNFLSWMDGAAYTDWAGLRPMTELEFEKACRGTATPVANEYAWGVATVAVSAYTLGAAGGANEAIATNYSTTDGNANYFATGGSTSAPLRVGIFAGTTGNTGRVTSGSTYYGIMEMSGNLWERAVTVGNATGRAFTGAHGNGTLTADGYADISTWPGYITSKVTDATGSGLRGGSVFDNYISVSNRFYGTFFYSLRHSNDGFRAVRTMPPTPLAIGDAYEGGIVAYILQSGDPGYDASMQKGLIAALADQSTSIEWITGGSAQTTLNGNTLLSIGTGQANTNFMMAQDGYTGGAAKVCDDYINTETGTGVYNDWYLPSKEELAKLFAMQILGFGGFASDRYWSSSEYDASYAWNQNFNSGSQFYSYGKDYPLYVRAVRSFPTLPTVTTASATSITISTATSGGEVTNAGDCPITARGVCWSTTTGPTIALTTKTSESGTIGVFSSDLNSLTESTKYYVRAYATSSAGTSYGNEVSFTTLAPPFVCGTSSLTINHVTTDGVAPVDKSVTYGTVSTTLFGGTKCVITRNLGASQQAVSPDDASEASAGWYWQFNRKQGWEYKTFLVPLTPAWAASMDNLSATWEAAKDPCAIELGTGWRIPTTEEWTTADALWNNYNDPYGSVLKLHAAGYLGTSDGSLTYRGSDGPIGPVGPIGFYWSSTQYDDGFGWNYYGWSLGLTNNSSDMSYSSKALGYSVRCIKDLLPTVTTTAVTSITTSTASSGGNVTDDGGSDITARGVCWSTTTGPTIALTTKTSESGTTGVFTGNLTSLASNTVYYVRAYATNSAGTAYGNEISFTTLLAIGDLYQGGRVAYLLQSGDPGYSATVQKGLIAALTDQSTGIPWITGGSTQTTLNGHTSTAYGTGQANTNFMIAQTGYDGGAAQVCDDYVNTETGTGVYSDWYLPSKDELTKLYRNRVAIGGFSEKIYWSSSEYDSSSAWHQLFIVSYEPFFNGKYYPTTSVRAVRAF